MTADEFSAGIVVSCRPNFAVLFREPHCLASSLFVEEADRIYLLPLNTNQDEQGQEGRQAEGGQEAKDQAQQVGANATRWWFSLSPFPLTLGGLDFFAHGTFDVE